MNVHPSKVDMPAKNPIASETSRRNIIAQQPLTQDFVVANGPAFVALDAKTFLGSLKLAPPCNASTHGVL